MSINFRSSAASLTAVLIVGGLLWAWFVVSYDPEYTTENTFEGNDAESSVSNSSNDALVSVEIVSGEDVLGWDQLGISLEVDEIEYPCSLTGISSVQQNGSKVSTSLSADGSTFAIEVDATSESTFTELDLSAMKQGENSTYSLRFSKTDIFLGSNATAMVVENQSFSQIVSAPNETYSLDNSEKLDWYDYDFSVHRIVPKEQVYIIKEENITYKVQFISYYNEDDESRHIQLIVAWISGQPLPAFQDSDLIAESPCIIEDVEQSWSLNQEIYIRENGIDICNQFCSVKIHIQYKGVNVKAVSEVEVI
tara:strand:- start:79 stop:1002 length:924 start_codon:yes stop_codon:yes gene_type:complete